MNARLELRAALLNLWGQLVVELGIDRATAWLAKVLRRLPMPHIHESSDFPGKVNAIALGAYPRAIASAFVRKNHEEKHAVIELGWHRSATEEQIAEARRASLAAVLNYLGDGWSGVVRNKMTKSPPVR